MPSNKDLKDWCLDAAKRENDMEVGVDTLGMDQSIVKLRIELTTAQKEIERLTTEVSRMDKRTRHLLGRIEDAETSLKIWDSSKASEYWSRYPESERGKFTASGSHESKGD